MVKKRNERLAHSSGENTEALNNKIKALGNKGNNVVGQGISADDFDVSVIMFNIVSQHVFSFVIILSFHGLYY